MANLLAFPLPKYDDPSGVINIQKLIKDMWDKDPVRTQFHGDPITVMNTYGIDTTFLTEDDGAGNRVPKAAVVVVDPEKDHVARIYDHPQKLFVYYAIVPPEPDGVPPLDEYEKQQAWEAAWRRATEVGYGM